MNAKKIISTYAKTDLSDTSKWYEKQQKGLGKRFLNEIYIKAVFHTARNPQFWELFEKSF